VHDELQPTFQDRDLEALKRRIRETTASFPATLKIDPAGDRAGSDHRQTLAIGCIARRRVQLRQYSADTIRH
jgi:hypothetical protein